MFSKKSLLSNSTIKAISQWDFLQVYQSWQCHRTWNFSEEEVWNIINDLGKEKGSRLDGFKIAFLTLLEYCPRGKHASICKLSQERCFQKKLKCHVSSLLPKVVRADDIRNLVPISLVWSLYKFWLKSSPQGWRNLLASLGPNQHAFILGHQIFHATLIACIQSILALYITNRIFIVHQDRECLLSCFRVVALASGGVGCSFVSWLFTF